MKKRGRPPKAEDELQTEQLNVRFTEEQKQRLDALARELRVSSGEVLRMAFEEFHERWSKKR
jgi:hypothetical protein